MFSAALLTPSAERAVALEQAWRQLVSSGPTLASADRIQVIGCARRAWAGAEAPHPETGVLGQASYWLAVDAEGITADLITNFVEQGLSLESYLEVVGIVARLSNIDWYLRAIGAPSPEPPAPDNTTPTGNIHPRAAITDSWVPMLGDASAPHTLDALPDEGEALRDLHEPMYVNMSSISDWALQDELSRPQIEFLAARTSYLNECFY